MEDFVATLSEEDFDQYRQGVLNSYTDKPKRLTEEFSRNWDEVPWRKILRRFKPLWTAYKIL